MGLQSRAERHLEPLLRWGRWTGRPQASPTWDPLAWTLPGAQLCVTFDLFHSFVFRIFGCCSRRPCPGILTCSAAPASPAVCRAVVSTPWSSVVKWAVGRQSPYGEGEAHPACPALPPKRTHTSGQPPPRGEEAEPGPLGRHPARSLPPSLLPTRE